MKPAIFFDRDGTLIFNKHDLSNPNDVCLIPNIKNALARVIDAGFLIFMSSNQSGIGRGVFTWADFDACNRRMLELIGLGDGIFTEIKAAPELPGEISKYRKPSPAFILEMIEKYDLDISRSWMVGDRKGDWEAGLNAGIKSAALTSGFPIGIEERDFIEKHHIPLFLDVPEFVCQKISI